MSLIQRRTRQRGSRKMGMIILSLIALICLLVAISVAVQNLHEFVPVFDSAGVTVSSFFGTP